MKRLIPLALLALALPATAQDHRGGPPQGFGSGITPIGNPSALIAAEGAFARLAREKGQWTAFAATSAEDAEMFTPQRVAARAWLKGRANPPEAVQWQPSSVWMSCDGSAGVTFGGWQSGTANGWFSTVWRRQPKKGDYKWVLDQGGDLTAPLGGADFITGKVADCPPRPHRNPLADEPPPPPKRDKNAPPPQRPLPGPIPALSAPAGADNKDGRSNDGTIVWRSTVLPGGAREWTVWMWQDGRMNEVLKRTEAAKSGS